MVQVLSKGYVNIGGFMMFRVVTGSMEPTMPTGTLLITREVDIETVALDDIVCFRTRVSEIWGKIVTHRVVDIMETAEGILLETKGMQTLLRISTMLTVRILSAKLYGIREMATFWLT